MGESRPVVSLPLISGEGGGVTLTYMYTVYMYADTVTRGHRVVMRVLYTSRTVGVTLTVKRYVIDCQRIPGVHDGQLT